MFDPKFLAFCMGEMVFNKFSKNGNLIIAAPREDKDRLKMDIGERLNIKIN